MIDIPCCNERGKLKIKGASVGYASVPLQNYVTLAH